MIQDEMCVAPDHRFSGEEIEFDPDMLITNHAPKFNYIPEENMVSVHVVIDLTPIVQRLKAEVAREISDAIGRQIEAMKRESS